MMRQSRKRRTFVLATILAFLGTVAFALSAQAAMHFVLSDAPPSDPPALLAPITEDGRVGWSCVAEREARASSVRDADLPASPR